MTDDPLGRDDASLGASDFLDWLDEMAAAEGTSREELIQTLISSYWTLDEMFRLMEQADPDSELPDPAALGSGQSREEASKRLADIERDLSERIDDVDDRLRYLRAELQKRPEQAAVADIPSRVQTLSKRVDALERSIQEGDDHSPDDERTVQALVDELAAVEDSLVSRHEELRERVDTEFGHLHAILEHLLGTTDDVADRTSRLEAEVGEFASSRDRLVSLKRTAAQLGVRKATCGYCGTKLDVALLPTPVCPQCERAFGDIEPKRGWFGSATLTIVDRPRPPARSGATRDDRVGSADDARGGNASRDVSATGFEWVGEDR